MLDTYLSLMNKKTEVWKRNTGGINTEPVIIPSGSHQEGAGLCQLREYEISSNMSLQPSNDRRLSGCSPDGCARPIAPTTETCPAGPKEPPHPHLCEGAINHDFPPRARWTLARPPLPPFPLHPLTYPLPLPNLPHLLLP